MSYPVVAVAFGSAYLIDLGFVHISGDHAPWWLDVFGPGSLAYIYWLMVDRWAWRTGRNRISKLADIPVFDGLWDGEIVREDGKKADVLLEVKQTLTEIYFISTSAVTRTTSTMAYISGPDREVRYEYKVRKHGDATEEHGLGLLRLVDATTLHGQFSGARDSGSLHFKLWTDDPEAFREEQSRLLALSARSGDQIGL